MNQFSLSWSYRWFTDMNRVTWSCWFVRFSRLCWFWNSFIDSFHLLFVESCNIGIGLQRIEVITIRPCKQRSISLCKRCSIHLYSSCIFFKFIESFIVVYLDSFNQGCLTFFQSSFKVHLHLS